MVVSVDISGILEERLRKLVELGIYASVSEAVRDAVRRLMEEIDLMQIGINIYINNNITLEYLCDFTGEPCNKVIGALLENGVLPLLGRPRVSPDVRLQGPYLIIAPMALYVIYNSYFYRLFSKLYKQGYIFEIAVEVAERSRLWEAVAAYRGILKSTLDIGVRQPCAKSKVPKNIESSLGRGERSTLQVAGTCEVPVVVADTRYERFLLSKNIITINLIDILYWAKNSGILTGEEALDIALSARTVPLVLPPGYKKDLGGE